MQFIPADEQEPPRDTPILAQIEFYVRGLPEKGVERLVCKIRDDGDLVTEIGDDIGWGVDSIVAWCELPECLDIK